MKPVLLPILALLAACGTPQEQCIARNTRDLRTVNSLIEEAEGNLARGYALVDETISFPSWEPCLRPGRPTVDNPNPAPIYGTCRTREYRTIQQPQSIDLAAEAKKLAQLKEKRAQLSRAAEPVINACRATYPE